MPATTQLPQVIKLRRIFNVFNPAVCKKSVFILVIFLLWEICLLLSHRQIPMLFETALFFMLAEAVLLMECPKTLSITETAAEFQEHQYIRPAHTFSGGFWWVKVSYTVSDIRDLQFHQNAVEKLFDIGHISFSGKAVFQAKRDTDRIKAKNAFVIYGIPRFSQFRQQPSHT